MDLSATTIALLIPLILIQLGLMIFALVDLIKREKVKGGNKVVWALVIILVGTIGPIIYLILGREDE
jgi:hypothetical protein